MTRLALFLLFAVPLLAELKPAELDRVAATELAAKHFPGLVLIVVESDHIAYAKGLGVASVETQEPVGPDHLFRVGSTTKMMTATALLALAGQGRVRMDAPIGGLISDLHPALANLTAHQLLSHTAGLMDRTLMQGEHDDTALAVNVRGLQPDVLFTKPGAVFSYSNLGFAIAGRLIETITGKAYADAMRDLVFVPLGMKRTTFRPTMAMTYPMAQGHDSGAIARPAGDHAGYWPAGSMFTSGRDFARMAMALLGNGKIDGQQALPAAVLTNLTTARVAEISGAHYGYGIQVDELGGEKVLSHGGSRLGYGTFLLAIPARRTAVIALANTSGADVGGLCRKVMESVTGAAVPQPKPTGEIANRARLVGVYTQYTSFESVQRRPDGTLQLAGGGRVATLTPAEGPCFTALPGGRVCFTLDAAGNASYLHVGSRAFKRID